MVAVAGLSNSKSAAPTPILSGHQLTQTLKATNNGPAVGNRDVTAGIQMLETVSRAPRLDQGWLDMLADYLAQSWATPADGGRGIVGNERRLGIPPGRGKCGLSITDTEQITTPVRSSPDTFLAQLVRGGTLVQGSAGCLDSARMTNAV